MSHWSLCKRQFESSGPFQKLESQVWSAIFFTRICEWIWLAETITVIGQKKSQIMRELNRPTFVLIFLFCLLAIHLCSSNKTLSFCFQLCFWSLLGSLMQNHISKQTRLCSFPSTGWFWVSNRQLLSAKYSCFSRANLGLLNTGSIYRGIRKGAKAGLRFCTPTLCNWELTNLNSLFNDPCMLCYITYNTSKFPTVTLWTHWNKLNLPKIIMKILISYETIPLIKLLQWKALSSVTLCFLRKPLGQFWNNLFSSPGALSTPCVFPVLLRRTKPVFEILVGDDSVKLLI